jgi:NADH-quinone oxidoreductase subunit M
MILAVIICVLLAGGLICWLLSLINKGLIKWVALLTVLIDTGIIGYLWLLYSGNVLSETDQWILDYRVNWIPSLGISLHLAMDGLSLVLLLLTSFLGVLAVLCSWKEIDEKQGFYYFNLLSTLAGISGVFIALDLFLFYFFWEVMLVPMFFLISIWGDTNRKYAAYKFFIFTQAGGLLMLLAILALYFLNGAASGNYSFDYFTFLNADIPANVSRWIMFGFLIAFTIKLPMVPFHNWLPDAHSEAPTAGSLILAGLLLKTGAYGIIRFVLPLFPEASSAISWWAMLFGVIGIIYGAFLAFAQTDLKRLIAYTSVSHMGFILLGIYAFNELAMQGVVMQMITHGISTGALFVLAGMIKERLHTRNMRLMGGLWTSMPAMGGVAMLFTMASLGLPALGNFIAEFLVLLGSFNADVTLTVIASLGLVFSAIYSLRLMQKVFLGPKVSDDPVKDISTRELIMMSLFTAAIILLGLYPQPVMDMVSNVLKDVLAGI